MAPPTPDPRVDEWLQDHPKTLRSIVVAARDLLDSGLPEARETIKWGYPTWVGKGNVAAIQPYSEHVNLQFYRGARLPDPDGVLEGTGKELRHVKLRHAKDVKTPAVKALVRAAWRLDQQGSLRGSP